jgi:SulP family sulfate permease
MGIINIPAGFMAAMPMCHGAGGLAAHYRFGARTGGSNLIIGTACIVLALVFGKVALDLITIIPQSVLGVLLVFAGIELALLARDIKERHEFFVTVLVAGIAVAGTNMAWAFLAGILADLLIRKAKIKV